MDSIEDTNEDSIRHKDILGQFKKNLSDVLLPDASDKELLKWLRARNFNLKKSEDLYRTNLRFRAVFGLDDLDETWEVPEVVKEHEFSNLLGMAKNGTPIRYISVGRGDPKGFVYSLDIYNIARYACWRIKSDLEICKEQSKKLGREINECTYILDLDEFNLRRFLFPGNIELALDLFKSVQDHYPEVWSSILVVNVPYYFTTLFNIFKPIFGQTLLKDIFVAPKDQTASLLLKHIDAEILPAFLGGKKIDSSGDFMCSEFVKFGGIVQEKYYLRNRTPLMPTDFDVKDVWIRARSSYNVSLVVQEADSILRTEYRFEGGTLTSCLLYRKFGTNPDQPDLPGEEEYLDPFHEKYNVVQCSPQSRPLAQIAPIDSYLFAPWPGIYILNFYNSSWFTQRRCITRVRVLPASLRTEET